ncbi:MAG: DUF4338 domain-containing protein [Deltaproteobacteria bacterium]|nr:DUF4338 domain-containing protein [Deltaproteobacteria bacterium]
METIFRYRGRDIKEQELVEIKKVLDNYKTASRWFLSKEICRRLEWHQINGRLQDMTCRCLLLRLEEAGLVELPPPKARPPYWSQKNRRPDLIEIDQTPVENKLSMLKPIEIVCIQNRTQQKMYRSLIEHHHYLHYTRPVGEHVEYLFFKDKTPIGAMGWSSAPRHIGSRDQYLGWNQAERIDHLHKVIVNTRFLILPWIRVKNLASYLLGSIARRISADWEKRYHHPIYWLETFVDPSQGFAGTCYKAANWIYLGQTTGRGKNDHTNKPTRSIKMVFGYPLHNNFREALYGM